MTTTQEKSSIQRCSNILRFWHTVEFFLPFDLQKQVLDDADDWSVRGFNKGDLANANSNKLWGVNPPPGRRITGFEVFFGIFDKQELTAITQQIIKATASETEQYEEQERHELEGLTCAARLKLNAEGEPLLTEVSISTAPWALGTILREGLNALDFDAFQRDVDLLKKNLQTFRARRRQTSDATPKNPAETNPMTSTELSELLEEFMSWTGYRYQSDHDMALPVIIIRTKSAEFKPQTQANPATASATANKQDKATDVPESATSNDDESEEGSPEDEDDELEIDILNSFYAKDIAAAIASMEKGHTSAALLQYLTPTPDSKRLDLYTDQGRRYIEQTLSPRYLPPGHWLDEASHTMSLMQQFAINTLYNGSTAQTLFSVNGPPGTGKTTLLRDVFAENIVRRARALAQFKSASEAFEPAKLKVSFDGNPDPCFIPKLRAELTGYEMVLASTNNAAVENISVDLQKTKELGKSWREKDGTGAGRIVYLREVAHNIAAKTPKGEYEQLSADDSPWGLIACALGNKRNRERIANGLCFDVKKDDAKKPKGYDPAIHQSLWAWRKKYQGASFETARTKFTEIEAQLKSRQMQLEGYVQLIAEVRGLNESIFCEAAHTQSESAQLALLASESAYASANNQLRQCETQTSLLREEVRLTEQAKPPWWIRWFRRSVYREYEQQLLSLRGQLRNWITQLRQASAHEDQARQAHTQAKAAAQHAEKALRDREALWATKQINLRKYIQEFPEVSALESLLELESPKWQIDGMWRDSQLNQIRSDLFVAALDLHAVWLATVLASGGGFGPSLIAIQKLLSGARLSDQEHALPIWQSLFMIVPVVSSTFASFSSQFRGLGAAALGWLFIDEAGQAVPQAAVGALWRAKRAVVVGDPMQIEPVFTVPIRLVEALQTNAKLDPGFEVDPHKASVQNLADLANPIGSFISTNGARQWVGSPLRVHRRCVDPMFSIANAIAYEHKMVFFGFDDPSKKLPPSSSLDIGESAWVQVAGVTRERQVVPDQIECIQQALAALYQRTGELPPVYIITPFRRIKGALVDCLKKPESWMGKAAYAHAPPGKYALRQWCKTNIGTVHTFQGKQQSIVWLVLGCDDSTRGAARWAASKPNLLNVALTRAQHRFFAIGDSHLWGGLPHFNTALTQLGKPISSSQFLRNIAQ